MAPVTVPAASGDEGVDKIISPGAHRTCGTAEPGILPSTLDQAATLPAVQSRQI
jgi:hypothetical protein